MQGFWQAASVRQGLAYLWDILTSLPIVLPHAGLQASW